MSLPTTGTVEYFALRYNFGTQVLEMNTGNETWVPVPITSAPSILSDGDIFVGNSDDEATGVTMSGDVTLDNAGVATLDNSAVTSQPLTGLAAGSATPIQASDTILAALANLQAQIDAL